MVMQKKFHLTDDGPKECSATVKSCPIGGEHYTGIQEARAAYESRNETFSTGIAIVNATDVSPDYAAYKPRSLLHMKNGKSAYVITDKQGYKAVMFFKSDEDAVEEFTGEFFSPDDVVISKAKNVDEITKIYHDTAREEVRRNSFKEKRQGVLKIAEFLEVSHNVATEKSDFPYQTTWNADTLKEQVSCLMKSGFLNVNAKKKAEKVIRNAALEYENKRPTSGTYTNDRSVFIAQSLVENGVIGI